MKIIFMGSPGFALPTLEKIYHAQEHEVVACYSQPATYKNRGKKVLHTEIGKFALENDIPLYTPTTLRSEEEQVKFTELNADIAVVAAYGMLLPQEILDAPKHGAINIHPSKLPRWRGAAPIQRTIMAGDTETEVCIMKMVKALDAGDVILSESLAIDADMTAGMLHDICAQIGAEKILEAIELIEQEKAVYKKQSESDVTYAKKIQKSEALIDFTKNGDEILSLIKGLSPYPGAYFSYQGSRLKIFKAEFEVGDFSGEVGTVINKEFHIKVEGGKIIPLEVQLEGKRAMTISEFLRGIGINS